MPTASEILIRQQQFLASKEVKEFDRLALKTVDELAKSVVDSINERIAQLCQ